jgi:siroheme synthase (precorrin-2 oxidase/ferrochelatase)
MWNSNLEEEFLVRRKRIKSLAKFGYELVVYSDSSEEEIQKLKQKKIE